MLRNMSYHDMHPTTRDNTRKGQRLFLLWSQVFGCDLVYIPRAQTYVSNDWLTTSARIVQSGWAPYQVTIPGMCINMIDAVIQHPLCLTVKQRSLWGVGPYLVSRGDQPGCVVGPSGCRRLDVHVVAGRGAGGVVTGRACGRGARTARLPRPVKLVTLVLGVPAWYAVGGLLKVALVVWNTIFI